MPALEAAALDQLFLQARTHNAWQDRPVSDEILGRIYELARMAPTSANASPMRIVFVKSAAAKERLIPTLHEGNKAKTLAAPATAIIAHDLAFHEHMPKLFPARDFKTIFAGLPDAVRNQMAFLNGALQGAYFILAARALGLDCGPMGGFDNAQVDAAFLEGTTWKSLFLVNVGYGDPAGVWPRSPRFEVAEAARFV